MPTLVERGILGGEEGGTETNYYRECLVGYELTGAAVPFIATSGSIFKDCGIVYLQIKDDSTHEINLIGCHSSLVNNPESSAIIDFGAASQSHTVDLSSWDGTLSVRNMTAGDSLTIRGRGSVLFESSCTGGNAVLFGEIIHNNLGAVSVATDAAPTYQQVPSWLLDEPAGNHVQGGSVGLAIFDTVNNSENMATTLESDGSGGYQFTTLALENAPSGGGGGTDWTATEREQIRYRLGVDGATGTPAATPDLATSAEVTAVGAYAIANNAILVQVQTTLEDDGSGGYQFTTLALENAPSGGGGGTDWTATEREQIRYRLGVKLVAVNRVFLFRLKKRSKKACQNGTAKMALSKWHVKMAVENFHFIFCGFGTIFSRASIPR